jgi:uncharacterized membrane protein YqjE
MEDGESAAPGLVATLRRLGATVAGTLHNRVELFAVELQEEKCWLISTLLWAGACIVFGILAVVSVSVAIVWLSPAAWRPYEIVALALLFIFGFVSAVSGLRQIMRERPLPLSDTVSELKKDIEWIQSRD